MKHFTINIISIFILIFMWASCAENEFSAIQVQEPSYLEFKIYVPDLDKVYTRNENIQPGMIDNINVLVFDHNGHFIWRSAAVEGTTTGNYRITVPQTHTGLKSEEKKRIIHFVGNYDWSTFDDEQWVGKSEKEVIPLLSVKNKTIAYWHRLVLDQGISKGCLTQTIALLRNSAKISIENETSMVNTPDGYLTDVSFTIGNFLNAGTVSPYNTVTKEFDTDAITESPQTPLQPALESNLIPSDPSSEIYCYERKNTGVKDPLFIILKAKFKGDSSPGFYKLDIINTGEDVLRNIQRNKHYIFKIESVIDSGFSTFEEAVKQPASNNLQYSIYFREYTSISDQQSMLFVEATHKTLVNGNAPFTLSYSYIPDISTGVEDNTQVSFTLQQDTDKPVILSGSEEITTTVGAARYQAKTAINVPQNEIYEATLKVSAKNNTLQRLVTLYLRKPYFLENLYVTPSRIPKKINQTVDLHFTIPQSINQSHFPFPIYITTNKLTPNKVVSSNSNLSKDESIPGQYRYRYLANAPGKHTVYFNTNSSNTTETIKVESDLFETEQVNLVSGDLFSLSNVTFTPNGTNLPAATGQQVSLNFTIPSSAVAPYTVQIRTLRLDAVSSSTGNFQKMSYGYEYTANQTGTQTILFETNSMNNQETVLLLGDQFETYQFERTCNLYQFTEVTANPNPVNPTNKGEAVDINFKIPAGYTSFPLQVFIATTQLIPADGNPSGLGEMVINKELGTGYYYTAQSAGSHTVSFKTRNYYSEEKLVISAEGFKNAVIDRESPFTFEQVSVNPKPRSANNAKQYIYVTFQIPQHSIPTIGRLYLKINGNTFKCADRNNINSEEVQVTEQPLNGIVSIDRIFTEDREDGYFEVIVTKPGFYKLRFQNRIGNYMNFGKLTIEAAGFKTTANLNAF